MAKPSKKKVPAATSKAPTAVAVKQTPPDQLKLNGIQAQRFAALAKVPVKEVTGQTLAALKEKYQWIIDPDWFLFQRVCGQVVRWDAASGTYLPVPNATVHVMDTDCDFLFYAPFHNPWLWCFPFWCRQEEMATTVTDECGRFCVRVPRFDIDWVVRWRLERYCFPEILRKPSLADILERYRIIAQEVVPQTGPVGPGPVEIKQTGISLDRLGTLTGYETAKKILASASSATFGGKNTEARALMNQPAFNHPVPPPTSPALQELQAAHQKRGSAAIAELVQSTAKRDYQLDLNRYVGPFLRWHCEWIVERELVPIFDVPDITFWVEQDVDADGDLETIYTEGYFHIGWKSGPLSDVTLHASANARVSSTCNVPMVDGCDTGAILFAGLMPANSSYIDANGYAWRVNPPHADSLIRASVFPPALNPDTPSTAPFTGTIQLYGCHEYPNAQYYRLMYKYNHASAVPFTGLKWYIDPWPGPGVPLHVVPDANGWYPILTNPNSWFPPNELLDWPTTSFPNGIYEVTMQLGNAAKATIFTTATAIPFLVDNSANAPQFVSLAWRVAGTVTWNYFPDFVCPMVHRTAGTDLEFRVEYLVSMQHLLKMTLGASGCGGTVTIQSEASPNWSDPPSAVDPYEHWHINPNDNTITRAAIFFLSGGTLPGCYGFTVNAYSRAFNPAGGDPSDPQAHDWFIDASWLNWSQANLAVAVVDV